MKSLREREREKGWKLLLTFFVSCFFLGWWLLVFLCHCKVYNITVVNHDTVSLRVGHLSSTEVLFEPKFM